MNNKLIESVVRQVILEYSGVSDEVINLSELVFAEMAKQSRNYQWTKAEQTSGEYEKNFTIDLEEGSLGKGAIIKLYGYDSRKQSFSSKLQELEERGCVKLAFGVLTKMVKLSIPYPLEGELDDYGKDYIITSLNHEIKHALQDYKRGGTKVSSAYQKAVKNYKINDKDSITYLMKAYVKDMYYVLDPDEVDARLQEIYIELRNTGSLQQSKAYQRIKEKEKEYVWLSRILYPQTDFDVEYYKQAREQFPQILAEMLGNGITANQFMRYCKKGIDRFNEHLRRVVGRYNMENNITRGSFKQYTQNEISPRDMFILKKKNPSLWKRLMSNFRRNS